MQHNRSLFEYTSSALYIHARFDTKVTWQISDFETIFTVIFLTVFIVNSIYNSKLIFNIVIGTIFLGVTYSKCEKYNFTIHQIGTHDNVLKS